MDSFSQINVADVKLKVTTNIFKTKKDNWLIGSDTVQNKIVEDVLGEKKHLNVCFYDHGLISFKLKILSHISCKRFARTNVSVR